MICFFVCIYINREPVSTTFFPSAFFLCYLIRFIICVELTTEKEEKMTSSDEPREDIIVNGDPPGTGKPRFRVRFLLASFSLFLAILNQYLCFIICCCFSNDLVLYLVFVTQKVAKTKEMLSKQAIQTKKILSKHAVKIAKQAEEHERFINKVIVWMFFLWFTFMLVVCI